MSLNVEQFAAANKATVDSLLAVANTALASAERIAALNLNTARSALEDTASGVQTVLSAKDPQAALAAQKSLAQPAVDKAVAYGKSVFEITSQTQQELAKMVEAQFSDFQKSIAGMVEMAAKSAPAGSEGAVAAIQNAIAAVHWPDNWSSLAELMQGYVFTDKGQGNFKLPVLFMGMLLPLLLLGPGKLSLDAWIRSALRRRCAGQASQHAAGEPMTCPKTP